MALCISYGDNGLALVKNGIDQKEMDDLLSVNKPYVKTHIGLVNDETNTFFWWDGTDGSFAWDTAWHESLGSSEQNKLKCGAVDYRGGKENGKWFMDNCNYNNYVLCNKADGKYGSVVAQGSGGLPQVVINASHEWAIGGTVYLVWAVLLLLVVNCALFAAHQARRLLYSAPKASAYTPVEEIEISKTEQ